MKPQLLLIGLVLSIFFMTGCSSLYTTNLIVTRGNSTGGSSSAAVSGDSFFLNIESSYFETVTWNITEYSGDDYHFIAEPGRHFIITGDKV